MSGAARFLRLERGDTVLVVDAELETSTRALDLALQTDGGDRAQAGPVGRSVTRILDLPDQSLRLHLRPVRHGGWLAPLWRGRVLGLGRPIAELEMTAALRARGAPVPRPLLVMGKRCGGVWSATLATEYEEDAIDGQSFIARRPTRQTVVEAARAAGRAVRRFHDAGGSHADLHIRNLLFREEETEVRVLVVDLDRGRIRLEVDPARRMSELMRLYRSLEKRALIPFERPRVCAAFFGAYVGHDRSLRKRLLSHRRRESLRLALHRLGYRLTRRPPHVGRAIHPG